jgi:hypothetical protein
VLLCFIDGACVKKPPRAGKRVCHAAFVLLLGGYEKLRSYTKVFVILETGTIDAGVRLHRPIKIPMHSVVAKAHTNKAARIADRYGEDGRGPFSDPRRVYCFEEVVNGNFIVESATV